MLDGPPQAAGRGQFAFQSSAKARRASYRAPFPPYNQTMDARPLTSNRLGLTTSQAARHLGVSLSTVRRWSDQGSLVGYRTPGGQRRFSVEQLDAFLRSLDQSPQSH